MEKVLIHILPKEEKTRSFSACSQPGPPVGMSQSLEEKQREKRGEKRSFLGVGRVLFRDRNENVVKTDLTKKVKTQRHQDQNEEIDWMLFIAVTIIRTLTVK